MIDLTRTSSESIEELAKALSLLQGQIHEAKAQSDNAFFQSKYADLATIWDVVRKPLTDNGLSVVQLPSTAAEGVQLSTILLHTSGQWIATTLRIACRDKAHDVGSAITYLRRYSLSAIVGVAVDQDDDGNAASAGVDPKLGGKRNARTGEPVAAADPKLADAEFKACLKAISHAKTHAELTAAGGLIRTSPNLTKEQRQKLVSLGLEAKRDIDSLQPGEGVE